MNRWSARSSTSAASSATGETPRVTGEDSTRTLATVLAVAGAARTGEAVAVATAADAATETLSVGVYYLMNFENELLTAALSIAQTVVLLICVVAFRRVAGREALTA